MILESTIGQGLKEPHVVSIFAGMLNEATASALASTALLLSGGLGGIAAGMPLLFLAAPFIAAGGLGLYYESRLLRDYLLFVGGAAFSAGWFIHHHFWFLDVTFQVRVSTL